MKPRGVAMLLVLVVLTVVVSAVSIIARARTTVVLTGSHMVHRAQLGQLLEASDAPIRSWLQEHAGSIVLPPEIDAPCILVSQSSNMIMNGDEVRIQITAWDQLGMYPRNAIALGLPMPVEDVAWMDSDLPGLDGHGARADFPTSDNPASVGGVTATHNPWPTRSGTTRARGGAQININTAPKELVERVFDRFGLGDPGWIFQRRVAGEFVAMTQQIEGADRAAISLVSVSRVWSFRIDAWFGTIRRSCWCIYANQGGNWRMVQRLAID